ncbi:MAG TPA: amino acid adenylation domain-containing protein [Longimicrobium sp.]|nr:amino acid adenylation domain-containing protein [Longimicrobium sp.]
MRGLAREGGATPFMGLLAAFAALLSRWTGEDDLVVGTPVAGRTRSEVEGLVGFFVNTLALRIGVDADAPFRALLARVRETALEAQAHQELPFERLVEALKPRREAGRNPIFQVLFDYRATAEGPGAGDLPGWEGAEERPSKFDLSLSVVEGPAGAAATWEYSRDRFDDGTVERIAASFETLLEAVAADPDRAVGALSVLTPEEEAETVRFLSGPRVDVPAGTCVHHLFEAQARRAPDATALVSAEGEWTYAALNARANRIARVLRRSGIGPEARVAVSLPRTPELVASLYAVLKAGGAYVPVDPAYPAERIAYMLEDSGARVLVTTSELADRLPGLAIDVVRIDAEADAARIEAEAEDDLGGGASPENLAYVIYTSGSTGRPKGVGIEHRATVLFLHWFRGIVTDGELASALGATSVSFDVSVAEVFGVLCWGGTLVLVENALSLADPLPGGRDVGLVTMVPSAAAELLRMGAIPASVRTLNLAGEALPPDLARGLYATGTVRRVLNLYGPTEDTTYTTAAEVGADGRVTLGRPAASTRLSILDPRLRPVPRGVAGELWISGEKLARGYLGRPGLTAERFLPDPFGAPGSRMYRVMDRARVAGDGALEYLGRTDHQVKVRGFRVEPGEVEAALRAHPAVAEAVVVVRADEGGASRLVGYVVLDRDDEEATGQALKAFLRRTLPEHMVPSWLVRVASLPRLPNGKLDRGALPAPDTGAAGDDFVAPRTATEEALARVWREVLGVDRVGADDDFFDLGGHSLLAAQVVSRVRDALGAEIPLRALFEAPRLAALAAAVDAARGEGRDEAPVVPVPRDRRLPLSFAQQRLWFLDQMEPGDAAYVILQSYPLPDEADAASVERSLGEVARRHEALRTTFALADGRPVQAIAPRVEVAMEVVDLRPLEGAAREAEARRAFENAAKPFDLGRGPLLRAALLVDGDGRRLLLAVHHIVSDGWSMGVIGRELAACLAAYAEGREPELPPLPVQYADYAVWQRERLQGERLERELAFWRARLDGAPEALALPADRPRPARRTHRGGVRTRLVSSGAARALRALAREEGATPFMTQLAAFAVVLARWTGEGDLVVGTPVAGRTRSELEGLVGFFVNSLPLRIEVDSADSFRALVRRVREVVLEAQAHQELPFERLVEAVRPGREAGRNPIFQVMFAPLDATAVREGDDRGPTPEEVEAAHGSETAARFDLTVLAGDARGGGTALLAEYAADLFDPRTVDRLLGSLAVLLDGAAATPDASVGALPVMTAEEEAEALHYLTGPEVDVPAGTCVHHPFEAQARLTPDAVALVSSEGEWTYAALNARANRIARVLRRTGIGPEARVAVSLPRTPDLVATLFAVLKAGGAYVPVDPAYPAERIAYMLEDSGARALVTSFDLADRLPDLPIDVLRIDADPGRIDGEADDDLDGGASPENLAYVIYTSGSTGRPKGVGIEHRATARFLHWLRDVVTDEELAAALGATSVSFDVSIAELFGTLSWGGTLVLVENALSLAEPLPGGREVALATLVPSAAAELLRMGAIPPSVRTLNLGGEPLPPDLARALHETGTVTRVLNLYGPTEDTTYTTAAEVGADGRVTLGWPAAETRLYVLDAGLRPVPEGVAGELWISGGKLARGYLGRPGLTAERFLPDPHGAPGSRMYRVMDRARVTGDGQLEYLGRTDHQVKVRGFRVEPGEIEAALRAHPAVDEAVVVLRADGNGQGRLAGYVVAREEVAGAELKAFLRRTLPEHMGPSWLVRLDALPRLPNGKVDRASLPAPRAEEGDAAGFVAARTPVEELVAALWGDALGVERVGAEDDFFDLGGHSLLAAQVVSRLREALGAPLTVRDLFEAPTVAGLARRAEDARRGGAADPAPPVLPAPRAGEVPLSFAQERLWLLHQVDAGAAAHHITATIAFAEGADARALAAALTGIVRRHEVLRTRFPDTGGRPRQEVLDPAPVLPRVIDLSTIPVEQRDEALARRRDEEGMRPFDPRREPLFRPTLFRLGEGGDVLHATFHHMVCDGWSLGVFHAELAALYAAARAGETAPLPEPPVQYADFAVWQRLRQDALEGEVEHWRRALEGADLTPPLAADFPRPAETGLHGARYRFRIPSDLLDAARKRARREGATLFMTLLAAWTAVLERRGGRRDLVVGTDVANRVRPEIEGLIGVFTNQVPLRVRLDGADDWGQRIAAAREAVLDAFAHAELPFERVTAALAPERPRGHAPVVQVKLVLENADTAPRRSGLGTQDSGLPDESGDGTESGDALGHSPAAAQLDLALFLAETPRGLTGSLVYDTDLFAPETAAGLADAFEDALRDLAEGENGPAAA